MNEFELSLLRYRNPPYAPGGVSLSMAFWVAYGKQRIDRATASLWDRLAEEIQIMERIYLGHLSIGLGGYEYQMRQRFRGLRNVA